MCVGKILNSLSFHHGHHRGGSHCTLQVRRTIRWNASSSRPRLWFADKTCSLKPRFAEANCSSDRLVARFDQYLVYGDVLWLHERVHHRRGHVLRIEHADSARLSMLLQSFLIRAHRDQIRRHVTGLNSGYLQPRASRLQPQALRERLHKELARRVDGEAGKDFASRVRGDGDDVPPSSLEHPGLHSTHAVERALAVYLDGPLPLLLAPVLHHGVVHDAGAVYEDLYWPELLPGARHE